MKLITVLCLLIAICLAAPAPVRAELVVNEVMANEPGSHTSLEWIEIYNNSPDQAFLVAYDLVVGNTALGLIGTIPAYGHFVVCRKLFSDATSPGFEEYWGDNSGVWGDSPEENFTRPIELSFPLLKNTDGMVALRDNSLNIVSYLLWSATAADGYSWERAKPDSIRVEQSIDPAHSTPGFVNSVTPLDRDLAMLAAWAVSDNGAAQISFTVGNVGLSGVGSSPLTVYDSENSVLTVLTVPSLNAGDQVTVGVQWTFTGLYEQLSARLSSDDRTRNNTIELTAPGEEYPPLILTEIMADPEGSREYEWVEVKNRLDVPFEMTAWQLGDALGLSLIHAGIITIEAGEYFIVACDSLAFKATYPGYTGTLLQPATWREFNNEQDSVRLLDNYDIVADRFGYDRSYGADYTWSKSEDADTDGRWGRSQYRGGTPGEINSVVFPSTGSNVGISVEPKIFAPGGYENITVLTVTAPEGNSYTLKIYDRQGRVVKTFADDDTFLQETYEWDGLTDGGSRLEVGMYIIFFEASGVESTKETVVLAR